MKRTEQIKDKLTKYNQVLNTVDGFFVFLEAKSFGYLPKDMARVHKRSLKRIYDARRGDAPQLLSKIKKRIEWLRKKKA